MPEAPSRSSRFQAIVVSVLVVFWIFWLRWPSFDRAFWNLDEGIYTTIGRIVLDGGVMYRDAIDLRGPVCHYLTAGILAIAGTHNVWALHFCLAGMIGATAVGLFFLGRRLHSVAVGGWAAVVFAALSTNLLYVGDAYAVSTEWYLAFFTTFSAWWFWTCWPRAGFWAPFISGGGYALAFLSKQPGLLDVGAPLALLAYAAVTRRLRWIEAARVASGLVSGFTVLTALVFAYFWMRGALADFYFYGWTFPQVYYSALTTTSDRLESALALVRLLGTEYPLFAAVMAFSVLALLHMLTRDQPGPAMKTAQPAAFFLLCWLLLSVAGSASTGKVHPHYYIQPMPAMALTIAWILGGATRRLTTPGRIGLRGAVVVLLAAAVWTAVSGPIRGRARPAPAPDAATVPADYIRAHSRPTDQIMVWGFYPDFYFLADRRPASRFLYNAFQTGLQVGKDLRADTPTDDAIQPGSMELMLTELEARRPEFFVDSSVGAQRMFKKYPLSRYPALDRFVTNNYVEIDPVRFRVHGFRVFVLRDSSRTAPREWPAAPRKGKLQEPLVLGQPLVELGTETYTVHAEESGAQLRRVELLVNDTPVDSISCESLGEITAIFPVQFGRLGAGRYRLTARATAVDGEVRTGPVLTVDCAVDSMSQAERERFSLPARVLHGFVPQRIRAPFGADAKAEPTGMVYYVHAPSLLHYAVPATARRVSGRFALRSGAYAPENPGRTDGAEFIVTWSSPTGRRIELMRQLLRPVEIPADRGEHSFDCQLPGNEAGTLDFEITNGPTGNSASDWTYWVDLQITADR